MDEKSPPARRGTQLSWPGRLLGGFTTSVRGNAQAFGFSITITVTYGIINTTQPDPTLLDLVLFALAAVSTFSVSNLVVAWLVRDVEDDTEPARVVLVGTATDVLAVGAGVGIAVAVAHLTGGWVGWVVAPLLAGLGYILVQSVELAAGWDRGHADGDEPR